MAVIAHWSGDGLTDGTAVAEATAGTGDTPLDLVTGGAFTIDTTGLHSPRLLMAQQASAAAQAGWGSATLGSLTGHAARCYLEMSAYPSAGTPILQAYTGGSMRWRLDITSAGLLRIRNAANTVVATAPAALPTGAEARIEIVVDGTSATAYAYLGDAVTALYSINGAVTAGADEIRFGTPNAAPTWPTLWLDELAVADTAALIGPATWHASAAWSLSVGMAGTGRVQQHPRLNLTAGVDMAASPHAARRAAGVFAADVAFSGAPRARRHATAAWTVEVGLDIDTGTPPISALSGGEWRPATVRHMSAGTWQPA